ncbi:DUF2946 family protein [uncultured Xylophilus sp.]|uniref:DUF2946 family protein n=1 Tax=uncultured Xylophilus sp. TaxID=296832 RepID=UPI0025FA7B99|nr:DUF2946 family protein [uncultured Xylophilus sp.]
MDDIVKQAMAKWPNVPACYGWLGLDARGDWYMRDDAVQAAGPFPQSRGSRLQHTKLVDFIGRNYACDAQGGWFFQNGPQRVYVELEITPWIWRVSEGLQVAAHTGAPARVQRCLLDEHGRVYLETDIGFGLVHSLDMALVGDAVEEGLWVPQEVEAATLPGRFGYRLHPSAAPV